MQPRPDAAAELDATAIQEAGGIRAGIQSRLGYFFGLSQPSVSRILDRVLPLLEADELEESDDELSLLLDDPPELLDELLLLGELLLDDPSQQRQPIVR